MATASKKFLKSLHQRLISEFKFNSADLDREFNSWMIKRGDSLQSLSDFYWACLNLGLKHFAENAKTENEFYENQRKIYLLMFDFLIEENKSRSHITEALNKLEINKAGHLSYEVDIVIVGTRDCEYGKSMDGLIIKYDTAINDFPLDYSKCRRNGGCVCNIGIVGKRDENDRLIMKK